MPSSPSDTDESPSNHDVADLEDLRERLADLEDLRDRVETLEAELERKDERIDRLECDCDRLESLAEAAINKAGANKDRVTELQSRELEKGAHLRANRVDAHAVTVADGRLERDRSTGPQVHEHTTAPCVAVRFGRGSRGAVPRAVVGGRFRGRPHRSRPPTTAVHG